MSATPAPAAPRASDPTTPGDHATRLAAWDGECRRIEAWLAALDGFGDQAPLHVVEAVRADYEARLGGLAREIAAQAETVRQALARARGRAAAATDRRLELRLRYLVGEIDAAGLDAGLDEQEAVLAGAVADQPDLLGALAEIESFLAMLLQEHPSASPALAVDSAPAAETARGPAGMDDDLAFLSALPASDPGPGSTTAAATEHAAEPPLHQDRFACGTCGVTNDPRLWYCEGCGAELG
jgi:hypothetical protein